MSNRADRILRYIDLFWLLFVLVLVLVLSPTGRYSYSIPITASYHCRLVYALVGNEISSLKVDRRPRRENALQRAGSEYRTIAMLLSKTSHRVRVPYAYAS
jgi:hypothetical protein